MWELLPVFWSNPGGGEGASRLERLKAKSQQITVWSQCFALYVSVMAKTYPKCVSELMANMCTIIHASQEYEDSAWVAYDTAYGQQAAATQNRHWSKINPSLFPMCFSGSSKKAVRCSHCNALGHNEDFCQLRGKEEPDVTQWIHAVESAVLPFSKASKGKVPPYTYGWSKGVCHEFNDGNCTHHPCKFRHSCSICGGTHPKVNCHAQRAPLLPKYPYQKQTGRTAPY